MKTRDDFLRESNRNAHVCGELPRALWYDDNGDAHYSIPYNEGKPLPAPRWLEWAMVAALALSLFGGAALIWMQGI